MPDLTRIDTAPRHPGAPRERDADLPEFLAERARGASDLRLAADETVGLFAIVIALLWPFPVDFFAVAIGGCFLGFGVWGIADRELQERGASASPRQLRLFRFAKYGATIFGAVSAAALAVGVMAVLIGRVIS